MKLNDALKQVIKSIKDYVNKVTPKKLSDLEIDMELGAVKTINGNEPDENGNVTIKIPEGFSGDYNDLKGKTHYDTREYVELFNGSFTTEIEKHPLGNFTSFYAHESASFLETGNQYKCVVDGKEYFLEPCQMYVEMNGKLMEYMGVNIGNVKALLDVIASGFPYSFSMVGNGNSDCNFVINNLMDDKLTFSFMNETEPTEHTVKVELIDGEFKQLDEKYIPDSVKTHDWNTLENRPFGEVETSEVVLEETVLGEFLELTSEDYILYKGCPKTVIPMMVDETYFVVFDGIEYECKTDKADESALIFGNNDQASNGAGIGLYNNSECPFFITYGIETNEIAIMSNSNKTGSTLSIYRSTSEVKKIDEKFIPDTISREGHIHSYNDLEGKTHYDTRKFVELFNNDVEIFITTMAGQKISSGWIDSVGSLFTKGNLMKVVYDNNEYILVAQELITTQVSGATMSFTYIGNHQFISDLYSNMGLEVKVDDNTNAYNVPFVVADNGMECMVWTNDTENTTHNIKLFVEQGELKQLDEKFLPDNISRAEHVHSYDDLTGRTHYDTRKKVELFNETFESYNGMAVFNAIINDLSPIKSLNVTYDNVEYIGLQHQTTYTNGRYGIIFGNTAILSEKDLIDFNITAVDTGEPFVIFIIEELATMAQVNDTESTSHTIAVYAENGELKQLDEKFIPDAIARKEDIENISSVADFYELENKPFDCELNLIETISVYNINGDGEVKGYIQTHLFNYQYICVEINDKKFFDVEVSERTGDIDENIWSNGDGYGFYIEFEDRGARRFIIYTDTNRYGKSANVKLYEQLPKKTINPQYLPITSSNNYGVVKVDNGDEWTDWEQYAPCISSDGYVYAKTYKAANVFSELSFENLDTLTDYVGNHGLFTGTVAEEIAEFVESNGFELTLPIHVWYVGTNSGDYSRKFMLETANGKTFLLRIRGDSTITKVESLASASATSSGIVTLPSEEYQDITPEVFMELPDGLYNCLCGVLIKQSVVENEGESIIYNELFGLMQKIGSTVISYTTAMVFEDFVIDDDGELVALSGGSLDGAGYNEFMSFANELSSILGLDKELTTDEKSIVGAINELNGKVSNDGSSVFTVNFTWDEETSNYVSDKTFAEITEAYENGDVIQCVNDTFIGNLLFIADDEAVFRFQFFDDSYDHITVTSEGVEFQSRRSYQYVNISYNTDTGEYDPIESIQEMLNYVQPDTLIFMEYNRETGNECTRNFKFVNNTLEIYFRDKTLVISMGDGSVAKKVDNAGGSAVFTVNITVNEEEGSASIDKTFNEVADAHNSGKLIICNAVGMCSTECSGIINNNELEGYTFIFSSNSIHSPSKQHGITRVVFLLTKDNEVIASDYDSFDFGGNTDDLTTTDKTLVGAINELNEKFSNIINGNEVAY